MRPALAAELLLRFDAARNLALSLVGLPHDAACLRARELGFEIVANSPEQFTTFQATEFARWKKLIETRKITAD